MLRPSLCDYSNSYTLVKETIAVIRIAAAGAAANNVNNKIIIKSELH